MNTRLAAARAILQVVQEGQSLNRVIPASLTKVAEKDRALFQELVYGVARWYYRLAFCMQQLVDKPLKAKDQDMAMLILVGCYQLAYMRIKPHAAVNETVKAAGAARKNWATKFINGVLRNFQREQEALFKQADESLEARWAHPDWLIEQLQQDWPDHWESILDAGNGRAPMTLRNNQQRQTRAEYLAQLTEAGIESTLLPFTEQGIQLAQPIDAMALPGFAEGRVSVQDGGAQLAAQLLDVQPGMRVLDACAAPGGKTGHILERQPGIAELVALDIDETRLASVKDNLARLGLEARLVAADASDSGSWWDGRLFDRILLDVPCSATGVIRRHPDIKLLRKADDIGALLKRQAAILEAVWPLLASGGSLLYATCSLLAAENVLQVQRFCAAHKDAEEVRLGQEWGVACTIGRQLLPAQHDTADMDGFYYALLRKA